MLQYSEQLETNQGGRLVSRAMHPRCHVGSSEFRCSVRRWSDPFASPRRLIDVVGSLLGLAITLPFFPLIAAAVYLDSPGAIFIRQRRAGQLGRATDDRWIRRGRAPKPKFREFSMLKFRSMRPDAEKLTGPVLATENDPRITRVGRVSAQDAARRAAAVHQRAPGRHEHRRAAPRAPRAGRAARGRHPLLRGADARREARDHGPRAGDARLLRASRRRAASSASSRRI